MVGRLQMDKTKRWVEYIEKHYRGGKLEGTTTNICRFAEPGREVIKRKLLFAPRRASRMPSAPAFCT
jgi:hypothetical protein